ncbi:MAG: outer membrane lipoprotein carrier protein LolA [Desulfobulbaceae bacterium]|nr:outer membrane lipoprotein carrier protein LolA [Desulfobulbaceae bacterium]
MTTTRQFTLLILGILLQSFLFQSAHAAALTPQDIAQKIQKTYAATKTLRADFTQTTSSRMSNRERLGAGTMVLAKPGLMRWDYSAPNQQVFVCDGKKISMYFSKEKQMMVTPAKDYLESDVTYSFFTGTGDIERDFIVTGPEEEDIIDTKAAYQLKLTPKKNHPQIDFIDLWVDRKTFLMNRLKVTDKFGTVTDLAFSKVITNQEAPAALFLFTPPNGTEIIDK